jgi:hypothetical protein
MRNTIVCLIFFLLLPVLYCEAKPKVQFLETIYDFGVMNKESAMRHTFIFKNTGSSPLVIERIKAG